MSEVFLSYCHEDQDAADLVVAGLKEEGFSVWWDHTIAPGQTWDTTIAQRIAEAKIMVVLWTAQSVTSEWVKEEASTARSTDKYFPAMMDGTPPPLGFTRVQAANLKDWDGDTASAPWKNFVAELRRALRTVAPRPRSTSVVRKVEPRTPAWFENYDAQVAMAGIAVVALVVGGGVGLWAGSAATGAVLTPKLDWQEKVLNTAKSEAASDREELVMARAENERLRQSRSTLQKEMGAVGDPRDYAAIDVLRAELRDASRELEELSTLTGRPIPKALFEEIPWRQASIDILNRRLAQVKQATTAMAERLPVGGPAHLGSEPGQ